jgi:cell division protein FtsQ
MLNAAANFLFAVCLIAFVATFVSWLVNRPYFSIQTVEVGPAPGHALRHVPQEQLGQAIREGDYGSFFTIDMQSVKANLEKVAWVRQATLRRIWPDKLVVLLEEHRPFALWGDGGWVINTFGELYTANLAEAEADGPLPQLNGPDGTELEVARRFAEISELTAPLELTPVLVDLSERLAWTVKLDDGTDLLIGREQGVPIAQRVSRWVDSYALVTERIQRRASLVDLRYPNGFSVRSLEKLADAFDIDDLIADVTKKPARKTKSTQPGTSARATQ